MKTIETLIDDIYEVVEGKGGWDKAASEYFGTTVAKTMEDRLNPDTYKPGLRMSAIGQPCARKLWYSIHMDGKGEPLEPYVRFKFLYGDILEDFLLALAVAAGHEVAGCQDEMNLYGIKGHRDAVIDGVTVDVKSASTFAFQKFKKGLTDEEDGFGYLTQLASYVKSGEDDPLVRDKSGGAFLVVDKQHGHLTLDYHNLVSRMDELESLYESRKEMAEKDSPPIRGFDPQPEGKSGNMKLGFNCSYCDFKKVCYPKLRTFLYKQGPTTRPVHLTTVVKTPKVPEVE